jgi:hypothetical protein
MEMWTYKSRGVIVPDGFGIPKSLQSRVSLDDLILQGPLRVKIDITLILIHGINTYCCTYLGEIFETRYAYWPSCLRLLAGTFFSEPAVSFFPVTAAILAKY